MENGEVIKGKDNLIGKREEELKNLKERITESETKFEELEKQYTELKQEFKVRFDQIEFIILLIFFSIIKNSLVSQRIIYVFLPNIKTIIVPQNLIKIPNFLIINVSPINLELSF